MMDNFSNTSCIEHIQSITRGLRSYEILSLLSPIDSTLWIDNTRAWWLVFTITNAVLGLIYFALGFTAVSLIVKGNCLRLKTRTFFAVYVNIAILGISRGLFLWLDPYSVYGYIGNHFSGWIVISRFIASLGFPSLVASCTIIIFTIIKIATVKPGQQWYEHWRNVILISVVPYIISVVAESLGHIQYTFVSLLSALICEVFFSLWGAVVCTIYICYGRNLLNELRASYRRTTMVSESNRQEHLAYETQNSVLTNRKTKKIVRKITYITYGTSLAGLLYSLAAASGVVIFLLFLFHDCMGFRQRTSAVLWLFAHIANRVTEIILSLVVLYSVTDTSFITNGSKKVANLFHKCCKSETVVAKEGIDISVNMVQDLEANACESDKDNFIVEAADANSRPNSPCSDFADAESTDVELKYTIEIHGEDPLDNDDSRELSPARIDLRGMTTSRSHSFMPLQAASSAGQQQNHEKLEIIAKAFSVNLKSQTKANAMITSSAPDLTEHFDESEKSETNNPRKFNKSYSHTTAFSIAVNTQKHFLLSPPSPTLHNFPHPHQPTLSPIPPSPPLTSSDDDSA